MSAPGIEALCLDVHASNVVAGWWTDIKTGASILATRNRPEMLMLAVSELAEAAEGLRTKAADDKLPRYPMYDVELADFVIRQLDQIGAEVSLGAAMPQFYAVRTWTDTRRSHMLLGLIECVAGAMEHYRKGRVADYVQTMAVGVDLALETARIDGIDLMKIIAEKRAYNATRADHKLEARGAADGKKF